MLVFAALPGTTQPAQRPGTTVEALFEQAQQAVGNSEDLVIKRLGRPLARTVDRGFNQHERGSVVRLISLHYSGLVVDLVHVPDHDKWMLSRLVMTDVRWADRLGLAVPTTRRELHPLLGDPAHADANQVTFQTDHPSQPGSSVFRVRFDGERAVAWVWTIWID